MYVHDTRSYDLHWFRGTSPRNRLFISISSRTSGADFANQNSFFIIIIIRARCIRSISNNSINLLSPIPTIILSIIVFNSSPVFLSLSLRFFSFFTRLFVYLLIFTEESKIEFSSSAREFFHETCKFFSKHRRKHVWRTRGRREAIISFREIFRGYLRNNRLEKALQSADSISVSIGTLVSPMLKYRRFRITVSITRFSIFQVERLCFVKTHGSIRGNYVSLCWKSISSGKKKKKKKWQFPPDYVKTIWIFALRPRYRARF